MLRKDESMRQRDEAGMSLVEIVIAIVILGAVVSALLAALATAAISTKSHRDLVTADAVLRDYAEATKSAVRSSCTSAGATYSVTYSPPNGFTTNSLTGQSCPATTTMQLVHLTVTLPNVSTKSLDIDVRSP
jgi:Tfp pilus assembly protein PilV